jgi:hypothetical protein
VIGSTRKTRSLPARSRQSDPDEEVLEGLRDPPRCNADLVRGCRQGAEADVRISRKGPEVPIEIAMDELDGGTQPRIFSDVETLNICGDRP